MAYKVRFKPIKASPLGVDRIEKAMTAAMKQEGYTVEGILRNFYLTWRDQPFMKTRLDQKGWVWDLFVYPYGDEDVMNHVKWVERGTRPHAIEPKYIGFGADAYPLRFKKDFISKTQVHVYDSRAGGKFGDYISKNRVMHPGITARNIYDKLQADRPAVRDGNIKKAFDREIRRGMQAVMRKVTGTG